MKRFELKIITNPRIKDLNMRTTLIDVMESAPPGKGVTMAEQRKCIKVLDKLEATADPSIDHPTTIILEDEEYQTLASKVESYPWGRVSHAIIEMDDIMKNAETLTPDQLKTETELRNATKKVAQNVAEELTSDPPSPEKNKPAEAS